jgi:hypothetical protein
MDRNIIRQAGTENAVRWSMKNANELVLDNVTTLLSLHAQSRGWDRYQESVCKCMGCRRHVACGVYATIAFPCRQNMQGCSCMAAKRKAACVSRSPAK